MKFAIAYYLARLGFANVRVNKFTRKFTRRQIYSCTRLFTCWLAQRASASQIYALTNLLVNLPVDKFTRKFARKFTRKHVHWRSQVIENPWKEAPSLDKPHP